MPRLNYHPIQEVIRNRFITDAQVRTYGTSSNLYPPWVTKYMKGGPMRVVKTDKKVTPWKSIQVWVTPDPKQNSELLNEIVEGWPERGRAFTQRVGRRMVKMIRQRMLSGRTLDGARMKPLSPSTRRDGKRVRGNNRSFLPLDDTGSLRKSLRYRTNVSEKGRASAIVTINDRLERAKASTHHFGAPTPNRWSIVNDYRGNRGRIPARPFFGLNEKERDHIDRMYIHEFNKRERRILSLHARAFDQGLRARPGRRKFTVR